MNDRSSVAREYSPTTVHYAALIAAQLAIGSAAVLARYGLDAGLSATALSAWRLAIAAAFLIGGMSLAPRRISRPAPIPAAIRLRLIVAGLFLGLHFVLWFASLKTISVARSTLLVTSGPVWTGLGGWIFLKHRLGIRFWAGLAVAGVGAFLITGTGEPAGRSEALGDILAVGGAVAVAVYLLLVQDLQGSIGTGRTVAWTYTSASVALWLFVLVADAGRRSVMPANSNAWGSVIGMALVPQVVGHTFLNWSLKRFAAGVVAAATLLEPIFAAALAWYLFGETVTAIQGAGAIILLAGVGLAIGTSKR